MGKITVIAEVAHNHNGDMYLAKKMIKIAKLCGANIVKTQAYDADTLGYPDGTLIKDKKPKIYKDLKQGELTKDKLAELKKYCDHLKIEFMCSAFDIKRLNWLENLGVKRHKIASRMIYDDDFIQAVIGTGKPIIASLGMWQEKKFPPFKAKFLYCVAKYPTEDSDMKGFPRKFTKYDGFSDHTLGTKWAKRAIKRGAQIIEKHFTLDKSLPGCDQPGSANMVEFKEICDFAKQWTRKLRSKT